jgi:hypothetical protein
LIAIFIVNILPLGLGLFRFLSRPSSVGIAAIEAVAIEMRKIIVNIFFMGPLI